MSLDKAIKNENAQQELFQKEIARLKEIIEQLQKEIEYLQGYTKVIGRVGGKTSE